MAVVLHLPAILMSASKNYDMSTTRLQPMPPHAVLHSLGVHKPRVRPLHGTPLCYGHSSRYFLVLRHRMASLRRACPAPSSGAFFLDSWVRYPIPGGEIPGKGRLLADGAQVASRWTWGMPSRMFRGERGTMDGCKQEFLKFLEARIAAKRRMLDESTRHSSYHKELSLQLAELLEIRKAFVRMCGGIGPES